MHAFTDVEDRRWELRLNVSALERLRDEADTDLMELVDGGPLLERLMRDPVLLCRVLWVLCARQAADQGVEADRFGEGLAGAAITGAREALLEEIVLFFHREGPVIRAQVEKLKETWARVLEATIGKVEGLDVRVLVEEALAEAAAALAAETDPAPPRGGVAAHGDAAGDARQLPPRPEAGSPGPAGRLPAPQGAAAEPGRTGRPLAAPAGDGAPIRGADRQGRRRRRDLMKPLACCFLAAVLASVAGCHGGLWFDPDDPESVDLAAGDLRATMAIGTDALLTREEASAAQAERLALIFEQTADFIRDRDVGALEVALDAILVELIDDPQSLALYERLSLRLIERIDAHLQAMDPADDEDTAAAVARTLTLAALEGVVEGARDHARSPPDEG